jgi:nucleoside 2-deoxyribosyltransferase
MKDAYPKLWRWSDEARPRRLSDWQRAPDSGGFYEIGYMKGKFEAMYCGRAAGVTLRQRLRQHYLHSHNANIRKRRHELWYRCKVFDSFELACYVEAVHIAALDYPWNNRNEWAKHWALEY